jgi:hypothetical protein
MLGSSRHGGCVWPRLGLLEPLLLLLLLLLVTQV